MIELLEVAWYKGDSIDERIWSYWKIPSYDEIKSGNSIVERGNDVQFFWKFDERNFYKNSKNKQLKLKRPTWDREIIENWEISDEDWIKQKMSSWSWVILLCKRSIWDATIKEKDMRREKTKD